MAALAAAILLHLLLDQSKLHDRWVAQGLDFNPALALDRVIATFFVSVLLLALAAVTPSIGSNRIAWWYYRQMEPINERFEAASKQMFPDLQATGGVFGYGVAGGLPNEFLITTRRDRAHGRGHACAHQRVAATSTSAPPGHYMRSGTFSDYDGLGWDNPNRADLRGPARRGKRGSMTWARRGKQLIADCLSGLQWPRRLCGGRTDCAQRCLSRSPARTGRRRPPLGAGAQLQRHSR